MERKKEKGNATTSPNNLFKNQSQSTNFSRDTIKRELKNSLDNISSLIIDLSLSEKDLCINERALNSYNLVYNLLAKIKNYLNTDLKSKNLEFNDFIHHSKFNDPNTSGTRILINISTKNEGETVKLEYYKNKYYNDIVIKAFYELERELKAFKRLNINNSHKRKILNLLLVETKEIKDFLKSSNLLHLLYFKREFKNIFKQKSNTKTIICYYYWTEKTEYITENEMDLCVN